MGIIYDPVTGEPMESTDEKDMLQEIGEATTDESSASDADVTDSLSDNAVVSSISESESIEENIAESESNKNNTEFPVVESDETQDNITQEGTVESVVSNESVVRQNDDNAGASASNGNNYSPIPTESNYNEANNFRLIGILATACVLIAVVLILWFSGIFLSKQQKISRAVRSTFEYQTELGKIGRNMVGILKSQDYTVSVGSQIDDLGFVSGKAIVDGKDKQLVLNVDADMFPEFSAKIGVDSKRLTAEIPEISDKLFVYDYINEKDGYITDVLEDKDIESIDSAIKTLYDGYNSEEEFQKKLIKCINRHKKELEYEKADSQNYKIDGKKVKCKGYYTEVDRDFFLDLLDDIEDIYKEEYGEYLEELSDVSGNDIDDMFGEAKKELKDFPDSIVYFYIYRGKLAAIRLEEDTKNGSEIEILFEGGDYRAQNISVEVDGDEVCALSGYNKKDKEIYSLEVDGEDIFTLEYNYKKETISFDFEYDYSAFTVMMDVTNSSKLVEFKTSEIYVDDEMIGNVTYSIEKGGSIQKYTNTDEFDIGNASKNEFTDLISSFDLDYLRYFF